MDTEDLVVVALIGVVMFLLVRQSKTSGSVVQVAPGMFLQTPSGIDLRTSYLGDGGWVTCPPGKVVKRAGIVGVPGCYLPNEMPAEG